MNARERLRVMIRDNHGSMTVWSKPEIDDAFAAYDAELLAEHGATPAGQDRLQRAVLFALNWHGSIPAELHEGINTILTEDSGDTPDPALASGRAEVLAEVTAWLVKKARECRADGGRENNLRANTIEALASMISRGAVRANNLRMLPADFFEPGHTYVSGTWKFRCEVVSASPGTGERRALGWKFAPVYGVHHWHAIALDPDDWSHGGWTDVTEGGEQQ